MLEVIHRKHAIINEFEVMLVDDLRISHANYFFLNCFGPTNVLSFPGKKGTQGHLALSLDALERECVLYGQTPEDHFLRLLAHGLCHLAGFEHGIMMDKLSGACIGAASDKLAHSGIPGYLKCR